MKRIAAILLTGVFMAAFMISSAGAKVEKIENGKKVKLNYTLQVEGKVVEETPTDTPLEYVQGEGQILPALEEQLNGLKEGQKKVIELEPADAFGIYNPDAMRKVSKAIFPEDAAIQQGAIVPLRNEQGQKFLAVIEGVEQDEVLLNFNHPLAGKHLTYSVKVVDVE